MSAMTVKQTEAYIREEIKSLNVVLRKSRSTYVFSERNKPYNVYISTMSLGAALENMLSGYLTTLLNKGGERIIMSILEKPQRLQGSGQTSLRTISTNCALCGITTHSKLVAYAAYAAMRHWERCAELNGEQVSAHYFE